MSSLPGILSLMLFIYVRPQEFVPALKDYPFLYLFLGMSIVGILHDVSERRTKWLATPTDGLSLVFVLWCIFTLAITRIDLLGARVTGILVAYVLYLVLAHGVQRVKSLYKVVVTIFFIGLFLAYVGADQGRKPFQCVVRNPGEPNSMAMTDGRECNLFESDGTPHDGIYDCVVTGSPGLMYGCEHAGLLGTTSVGGGRVRYLGVLEDPNELALATAIAVPMAFALFELRRGFLRLLLLLFTLATVTIEIVYTQSRGGQLTFAGVLGAYFIRKYGWKRGLVIGALAAVPMLAKGGNRSDADASTIERLGCAAAGIQMLMSKPITGIGYGLFTDHHFLTAHNSYVLAAGELGIVGMWLFASLMYLAVKVPVAILKLPMPDDEETKIVQTMAMAVTAMFCGGAVGIFFLSWTYHYVLWIHFGIAAALFTVVKRRFPTFRVDYGWKEKGAVLVGLIGFLAFWTYYIKSKGAWE